jgi:hypothetical protein
MRRLPVILATTHILLCGLIFGSAIANPERAGLLPLIALAIDWPASLAFNGLSDALIGFSRNKLLWDAAFYMVLGTIWFYWVGRVLQMLFRWATNKR